MSGVNFKGLEPQTNPNQKDNPGFFKKLGAGVVGLTAAGITKQVVAGPITLGTMSCLCKINRNLTQDEVKILNKAGEQVLKDSGLAKKGVVLVRDLPKETKSFLVALGKFFRNEIPNGRIINKIVRAINPYYMIKRGENAGYMVGNNVAIATDKIALSQFHELGHAMNEHSKFGGLLQKLRLDIFKGKKTHNSIVKFVNGPKSNNRIIESLKNVMKKLPSTATNVRIPIISRVAGLAATSIALVSIFKNKKAEGEKPQGIFDTVTTFIKNNVGKLTFLTMLPIVLEEGLATLKGEKAVKGLISKDLFKKVKISNRLGLATYATVAAVTGFGAYLASKIRDKIAQPNLNKN